MNLSKHGLELIKQFEGFRAKPYRDSAGVATIGYGSTYYKSGKTVLMSDSAITERQAVNLMLSVMGKYELAVTRYVKVDLNQNQFDALTSFAYNLGMEALRKSTLLKLLNKGLYSEAAGQFKRWVYADGKVSKGLKIRRAKERAVFLMNETNDNFKGVNSMSKILDGYKTYIGIFFTTLGTLSGVFGWEVGALVGAQDFIVALAGSAIALYGYIVTNRGSD